MVSKKGVVGPIVDLFSASPVVTVDITITSPSYSHAIKDSVVKIDVTPVNDDSSFGDESESPDFTKLAVLSGMYLGSFDSRLCREMRPYAVGSVESADGTWMVVWNLRFREDRLTRLRKAVEAVAYKSGKVMVVCTHRQRSRLAVMSFSDLDCVHLVTKKWLNGMLSNHDTLRELVLKYRVTPSFEVTNATRERFDRYLAPIEGFLKSKSMPSLVLFINSGDHVTSIREVYNMGIPVAALCDVDASWNTFVDYAIPFPSRADAKSDVIMAELETREYAQSAPRFVFMTLVRYAIQEGVKKRVEEESASSEVTNSVGLVGKRKSKSGKKGLSSAFAAAAKRGTSYGSKWWTSKRRAIMSLGREFDRIKFDYEFFEDSYLHLCADMELGEPNLESEADFLLEAILVNKDVMDRMISSVVFPRGMVDGPSDVEDLTINYVTDFSIKRKLKSVKGGAKSGNSSGSVAVTNEVVPIEVAVNGGSSSVGDSNVSNNGASKSKSVEPKVVSSKGVKPKESKVMKSKDSKVVKTKEPKEVMPKVSKPVESKPKSAGSSSKGVDKKEVVKSGSRKGDK